MNHAIRARHALLSSLGLLPLGCGVADAGSGGTTTDQSTRRAALDACEASTALPSRDTLGTAFGDPLQLQPVDTGLQSCKSGVIHRPEPVTCQSALPRPLPPASGADAGAAATTKVELLYSSTASEMESGSCSADADCDAMPFGYCAATYVSFRPGRRASCYYGCVVDADCGAGFVCECGDPVGQCVRADCISDEDCGDRLCTAWFNVNDCGETQYHAFACQRPDDECNTSADCAHNGSCVVADGRRQCQPGPQFICGRPFLVQGAARMADLVAGGGWARTDLRALEFRAPDERLRVAEHWARAGLMEHASIAAFARFSLQLMHLGAPPELLEASQRAMRDETEHARLCFGLAERYLGAPVGAGPLPMDNALLELDFERILALCFREGCVGETVAALEARVARDHATDARVKHTLDRIAADEENHARLAWEFIHWALRENFAATRALLGRELRLLADELSDPVLSDATEPGVPEHGVLADSERSNLRQAALREVVLPCAEAMLARTQVFGEVSARAAG
jgi:hypothetical protein